MSKIPTNMKFACLVEKGKSEIRERPIPKLGDYDVLLSMKACNICTVDYQQFMGLREHQGYPMAGGHEGCGTVVALGNKVTDFAIGDLVATGYQGCGHCEACRDGHVTECAEFRHESEDGYKFSEFGFADYTVKSIDSLYKLRKDLNPSEGAFCEPLATVLSGIKQLRVEPFETIVVIGAGPMGLLNALAARAYGANVIVTEVLDSKIAKSKEMGFTTIDSKAEDPVNKVKELTNGKGADAVIGAVANTKAYDQGLEMMKDSMGRFLVFAAGYPAPELHLDANKIHYKKMTIVGTYGGNNEDFKDAANALNTGMINVSELISDTFKLEDIQEAYEAAVKDDYRASVIID